MIPCRSVSKFAFPLNTEVLNHAPPLGLRGGREGLRLAGTAQCLKLTISFNSPRPPLKLRGGGSSGLLRIYARMVVVDTLVSTVAISDGVLMVVNDIMPEFLEACAPAESEVLSLAPPLGLRGGREGLRLAGTARSLKLTINSNSPRPPPLKLRGGESSGLLRIYANMVVVETLHATSPRCNYAIVTVFRATCGVRTRHINPLLTRIPQGEYGSTRGGN